MSTTTLSSPWTLLSGSAIAGFAVAGVATIWAATSTGLAWILTVVALVLVIPLVARAFIVGASVTPTHLKVRRVLTTRTWPVESIDAISIGHVDRNSSNWAPLIHSQGNTTLVRSLAGYNFGDGPNSRVREQANRMAQILNVTFDETLPA